VEGSPVSFFAPIVEGHGEVQCVERLLWRIAREAAPGAVIRVNPPIRVKAGAFRNDAAYRARHTALAAAKAQPHNGVVLVILDSEDDCPAQLGPLLLNETRAGAAGVPVLVALAHREYETWFVAAVDSLRGLHGFATDVTRPQHPEAMRDAKGWLDARMTHGYDPVIHQREFTQRFDLAAARRVHSFDRLYRKVSALVMEST